MKKLVLFVLVTILLCNLSYADDLRDIILPKGLQGITIGGVYYLHFQKGKTNNEDYNSFNVSRAYLTVKKKILPNVRSRITFDIHQDNNGDMKVRLKYAYANFKLSDFSFITKPNIEFGMVHTPWLDFEEHVNYYRMQGHMFMEEEHLFNSADFGFTYNGLFGGEMDDSYKNTVNKKYPGKYGSFAVGVYNGGGYHAKERNENKAVEGRITIRPVPDITPGLQLSFFSVYGKANLPESNISDWRLYSSMLSYEHQYLTFTGQFVRGKGNQNGNADYMDIQGYSIFLEGKFSEGLRVTGRFDSFDENLDVDDDEHSRLIIGAGRDFGKHNILMLDYQLVDYAASNRREDTKLQLTMQIHF